ncbi:hypothetical protein CWATWH0005_1893 [Crocosphaera watsonii WH 0005]|uniref:Uncharacterized protein n=1 Tax=Crocosphaera watsonii WH 0005 TaxID=423472 RepID=T2IZU9_CROWT|nr:hypothetical protein CWATWH0005_1893 [Crocosphaera watsonii WH 0005]
MGRFLGAASTPPFLLYSNQLSIVRINVETDPPLTPLKTPSLRTGS